MYRIRLIICTTDGDEEHTAMNVEERFATRADAEEKADELSMLLDNSPTLDMNDLYIQVDIE